MINWIKYDPHSPPEFNHRYLVLDDENQLNTAILSISDNFGLAWWESRGLGYIGEVTHYCDINLPGEETE
ncbi:hypothetical protein [Paenibacillus glucanolyticus]|uniref:hypothetical protein n=1 Tax=Paenibacillus glucanolyticus TaxID=59843 RepID=UPI00096D6B8A|nr:hypothetical protein [Paenibacillus glucanolyticus]OMF70491.1 hypothetical protein BK142_23750 [Paenibacillus glucanolyticus]